MNQSWTAEEIARLQDAMSESQADWKGSGADWSTVAFLVGNRTPSACRAQWGRMCEAWTCKSATHLLSESFRLQVEEEDEELRDVSRRTVLHSL